MNCTNFCKKQTNLRVFHQTEIVSLCERNSEVKIPIYQNKKDAYIVPTVLKNFLVLQLLLSSFLLKK